MSYIACVIDLNAYVTDLNIKRYRKLLETSVDATEQQTIHTLLAEEKAKAALQASELMTGERNTPQSTSPLQGLCVMDKDRIAGSAKQIKGAVKQAVGKAVGDAKLESEARPTRSRARCRTPSAALRVRPETCV